MVRSLQNFLIFSYCCVDLVTPCADAEINFPASRPQRIPNTTNTKSILGQLQSLDFFRQQSARIQLLGLTPSQSSRKQLVFVRCFTTRHSFASFLHTLRPHVLGNLWYSSETTCEVVEMYNLQPRAAAATSDVRA